MDPLTYSGHSLTLRHQLQVRTLIRAINSCFALFGPFSNPVTSRNRNSQVHIPSTRGSCSYLEFGITAISDSHRLNVYVKVNLPLRAEPSSQIEPSKLTVCCVLLDVRYVLLFISYGSSSEILFIMFSYCYLSTYRIIY